MPNKMLIDASHREETRVVVTRGNRIEEFDFESQDKKQLKGNIYLARVTRVEPSLQAAFVEYGGNRHGFLAFSEIHPDYYQIPVADRQALLRADAEAAEAEEEEDEAEERGRNRRRGRSGRNRRRGGGQDRARPEAQAEGEEGADATAENHGAGETKSDVSDSADENGPTMAARAEADVISERAPRDEDANGDNGADEGNGDNGNGNSADDEVESVGAEDALEEVPSRRKQVRRHYKIQEVIKRRQILLVQVVKEERGNKGAALTTYLSLAGRYSVLMPNTARGGGISRKITSAQDRKRLKDVVSDLDVPEGMGVILRTAGANRTKAEIKRDYEYLMRLWENVRNLTLASTAPALVYEEGSLIKRSVRDLYNKDIEEILVAGEDGYREAKDFMRMLMPSHAKMVQPYRDNVPIFARNGIEAQLDRMLQPQVTLKSGGYIIINQTEALVSIDVNSGRSTKEHSIEDTALQTNLEAAEEVARQLRLRDLAGLIVIDFIDMEENRNNRSVEKKMKDCLKNDRARIQVGRISHFGLLEMSRQRIRASVLESTMKPCPHCGGTGHVRSDSSVALHVVRGIEEALLKDARNHITVRTPVATALYVLNHKRDSLVEMEARFGLTITIEADDTVGSQHFVIARGMAVEHPVTLPAPSPMPEPQVEDEIDEDIETPEDEAETQAERADAANGEEGEQGRRKRRRRRRRGGRDREAGIEGERVHTAVSTGDETDRASAEAPEEREPVADSGDLSVHAEESEGDRKKRRRGKRGGKRNRKDEDGAEGVGESAADGGSAPAGTDLMGAEEPSHPESPAEAETVSEAIAEEPAPVEKPKRARRAPKRAAAAEAAVEPAEAAAEQPSPVSTEAAEDEAPAPKRRVSRRKPVPAEAEEAAKPVVVSTGTDSAEAEEAPKPRKGGWWQRKGFF